MKKRIVLGITSGIAAYKAIDLINMLQEENLDVKVIMTEKARKMISTDEVKKATGDNVYTDLFEEGFDYKHILEKRSVDHIKLADSADVFVVIPATANTIAKIAHGIADDFLTTTLLATTAPVIICPAMNVHMWSNPAVEKNIKTIQEYGYQVIKPAKGMLACGYEGIGRLEDLQVIKTAILEQLQKNDSLKGKKILVTAGGTIEPIDDVRYITNKSSGKMGIAIAEECQRRGAEVLLLRAITAVQPRHQVKQEFFQTAEELQQLIVQHIKKFDVIFHTAAVSDFKVLSQTGKMNSEVSQQLSLEPRTKILDLIKLMNPTIKLIAFKAESNISEEELIKKAQQRLQQSKADIIIANDVGKSDRGFGTDTNEVIIIRKENHIQKISLTTKKEIAKQLADLITLKSEIK